MAVAAPALAEMETVVSEATAPVVTLNEAVLPPAGIVTTVGTDATPGFDDESATAVPPDHAGAPMVTVPATDRPPKVAGGPEREARNVDDGVDAQVPSAQRNRGR